MPDSSPANPFRAAAIQMASGPDLDDNLARSERLVAEAAAAGATLVCLPEVFTYRGPVEGEERAAAAVPGALTEQIGGWARTHGITLQAGSILERVEGDTRCYNTAILFDSQGKIIAQYRKIHLFDVEIPGQVVARESKTRLPGTESVTAATDVGTIGLSVCYDLRFPELYRTLATRGAEILTVPAAFTFPTGAAHWEVLLRARAIENQCWVIAANQHGKSPYGHRDYGSSMIIDPWGTVIARAGTDGDQVISAEIRPAELQRIRSVLPALEHRRLS